MDTHRPNFYLCAPPMSHYKEVLDSQRSRDFRPDPLLSIRKIRNYTPSSLFITPSLNICIALDQLYTHTVLTTPQVCFTFKHTFKQ